MEIFAVVLVVLLFVHILAEGEYISPQDHLPEHSVSANVEIPQIQMIAEPVGGPEPSGASVILDARWRLFPPFTPGGTWAPPGMPPGGTVNWLR